MKKFALMCENRHEFEGWFSDAAAVRVQADNGLIDCPFCGSLQVQKQLSAPNLSTPKTQARIDKARIDKEAAETPASKTGDMANSNSGSGAAAVPPAPNPGLADSPASAPALVKPGGVAVMAQQAAFRQAIQQLRKTIETEFTDVGDGFAEEARKIHYGEAEHSNIYGTCTKQETEELLDEGVEILPLPELPPEH
ncbi:MAG: DUF1178 family protein [Candidatus Puniceispirillaceae bacterium]